MKLADGEVLDDALELFHSHAWVEQKPELSAVQLAELIPVLAPLFQRTQPKVRQARKKLVPEKADKGSQSLGRKLVYARSGGRCEIQLADTCAGRASEWHHRLNKGQGGRWDASNGLHLCAACHDYVTNRGRAEAKVKGWAVPPGRTPPIEVPVLRRGVLVYLNDKGGLDPAEGMVA